MKGIFVSLDSMLENDLDDIIEGFRKQRVETKYQLTELLRDQDDGCCMVWRQPMASKVYVEKVPLRRKSIRLGLHRVYRTSPTPMLFLGWVYREAGKWAVEPYEGPVHPIRYASKEEAGLAMAPKEYYIVI